jgi:putative PIG3 family NAD(P)H quinone oxidoreductase
MKAIVLGEHGDESVLKLGEVAAPELRPGALRIAVKAAALNRGDLMQRRGLYPPPPGASDVLGLECAGEVLELGEGVSGWKVGDRAMALLAGGGYAEEAVVDAGSALRVPGDWSWPEAAAFPETHLTVYLTVWMLARLPDGGSILVHGGGSGIGTCAIALAKLASVQTIVTAGSPEKCARCLELGADRAIDYSREDFAEQVAESTEGQGVDVVLDSIGASYLDANLRSLKVGGRLVLIGLMGGAQAELNMGALLARRLQIIGSTLRARPESEKAAIVSGLVERFGDAIEDGRLRPVVDRVYPLAEAADAHRRMQASEHFGKIVLEVA